MNFDHDVGLIDTLQQIDTTSLPPLGGTAGTLTIVGTGALKVPTGTSAQAPTGVTGMIRFNTTATQLETYNGTSWIASSLNDELIGLSGLSADGLVTRTANGTYTPRSIAGTASNITVTNGDGVAGNPTINLATVTQGATGTSFVKVQLDTFGRVINNTAVVAADITALVNSSYVNVSGDSMTSAANLTFSGGGEVLGLPTTPSTSTAAASKAYVDSVAQGLDPKASVRVATTTNGTLASAFANGQTVDGIVLATGDRILLKNQSTASENGIYTVNASGAPTRATDMDIWAEVPSAFVFVEVGTTNGDTGWVCTSDAGGTIGSTSMSWVQFSGTGTYVQGVGISISGNTIALTSPVTLSLGGTNNSSLAASNGGIVYTDATKMNVLAGTATAGNILRSGASTAPSWSTATYPATTTAGQLLYSSATNTIAGLALGTANQVLGMNNGATAPEYKTITQGTGITVSHGAGTITISNTVTALQLVKENPSAPTTPTVTGTNSVAIGNSSNATAVNSTAIGNGTDSKVWGGVAIANGRFATNGDAQSGTYILRAITTDGTANVELFLDGAGATRRLTLSNNSLMTFTILVAARRTDTTGGGSGYRFDGVIRKDTTAGSTTFVGTPSKSILGETNTAWNVALSADTTNGSLKIAVTGEAAKTIRWVATVMTSEVTN